MRFILSVLLILSLIVVSLADDSSEGKGEEENSDEEKGVEKPTEKSKKGEKKKDSNKKNDYDDESEMTGNDLDNQFVGTTTTEKTRFGGSLWEQLVYGFNTKSYDETATTVSPSTPPLTSPSNEPTKHDTETKDGSEEGQSGCQGSRGYPRPVGIWDRLFVLAAFPICFFAVMLKAGMFC